MKYKAIIFDISDTIVEYKPNYAQIYGDRLQSLGFDVPEKMREDISKTINWTIYEQMQKQQLGAAHLMDKELNMLLDRAALSYVISDDGLYDNYILELSKLPIPKQELLVIDDVFPVLNVLKNKYHLGIISNHHPWMMEFLNNSGLAPYFSTIIISEIVGISKPDIRIMQLALDDLLLKPDQCLYVGDQPLDVLCSKQIGMDCAWITKEKLMPESIPYKEDYTISRLYELLNIL
jgi:haloacid dehalogenase superfamily, subfamily IA, variant 1 with third motif having Dx(3-4)D or Dx(3-4)E